MSEISRNTGDCVKNVPEKATRFIKSGLKNKAKAKTSPLQNKTFVKRSKTNSKPIKTNLHYLFFWVCFLLFSIPVVIAPYHKILGMGNIVMVYMRFSVGLILLLMLWWLGIKLKHKK